MFISVNISIKICGKVYTGHAEVTTHLYVEEGGVLLHQRRDPVRMACATLHVDAVFAQYLLHFLWGGRGREGGREGRREG